MKIALLAAGAMGVAFLAVQVYGLYVWDHAHDHRRDDEHYRTDW